MMELLDAPKRKEGKLPLHEHVTVKHTVAVMSGKGGVGKSSVTALLASALARKGYRVGILDADITGPSIPRMLGVKGNIGSTPLGMVPPETSTGIKVVSLNLFLSNEDDPVIWRGPLISSAVRQFWTDVLWGDLDFMVVDLPPGTGDAPLTVLQSLPLDGLLIVSSPQDLVFMVVKKAINMAGKLGVPILGLVENMSGFRCPHCGEDISVFGKGHASEICRSAGIDLLGTLPLDPLISELADDGQLERYKVDFLEKVAVILGSDPREKEANPS